MTLLHPVWLALLAALPLWIALLLLLARQRRGAGERFARPAPRIGDPRVRVVQATLGVALCLCAAAGPGIGRSARLVPMVGLDVVLAFDASRSMLVTDVVPDRLARARREALELVAQAGEGRIGLVVFGGAGEVRCPLTRDRRAFEAFVREIDPDLVDSGGTDLAAGIGAALALFDPLASPSRHIVVLSDGEHLGDEAAIDAVAAQARAAKVAVHAVLVGSAEGGLVPAGAGSTQWVMQGGSPVRSRADATFLQRIARRTGGSFCDARQEPYPVRFLMDHALPTGSAAGGGFTRVVLPVDRYRWFLLVGLLCLAAAALGLPRTVRHAPWVALLLLAPCWIAWTSADPVALAAAGDRAFAAGDLRAALAWYQQAADQPGAPAEVSFNLGLLLHRAGEEQAAIDHFDRLVASGPAPLRARAEFAAGLARAALAERPSGAGATGDAAVHLRAARAAFLAAIRDGYGRSAAHNLEIVALRLAGLADRDGGPSSPADGAADQTAVAGDDAPGEPGGDDPAAASAAKPQAAAGSAPDASARRTRRSAAEAAQGDDGERLPGGMYRQHAENLFEIVRRMERERLAVERQRARSVRALAARDW